MAIDAETVYDVSDLIEGETVVGRVQSITDFGAFIEVGAVTGLLHISNMSWEHVDNIEDIVQVDDDVEVKILRVDIDNDRVEFGLKQLQSRPTTGRRGGGGRNRDAGRSFGEIPGICRWTGCGRARQAHHGLWCLCGS